MMRILILIIFSFLASACPRVKTNTQRFPIPNIFFTDNQDRKLITQVGSVSTTQKQEMLTGSGSTSKFDQSSGHLLLGALFKSSTDLAVGAVLSPVKSFSTLMHYRLYRSDFMNLYGSLLFTDDQGVLLSAAFHSFDEKWFPFISIQGRQVVRAFDSFPDAGTYNYVKFREEIMDYQFGLQFRFDLLFNTEFDTSGQKKIFGQILIGNSQVTKIHVLSEDYTSNYKDELGFTYGVSMFAEY